MNNVTSTRLYFILVLVLLTISWGISHAAVKQVKEAKEKRDAQIEQILSSME